MTAIIHYSGKMAKKKRPKKKAPKRNKYSKLKGDDLRELRLNLGWPAEDLANLLGYGRSIWSRYENDHPDHRIPLVLEWAMKSVPPYEGGEE